MYNDVVQPKEDPQLSQSFQKKKSGLDRGLTIRAISIVAVLLIILIAVVIVFLILYETKDDNNNNKEDIVNPTWHVTSTPSAISSTSNPDAQCEELRQCRKKFDKTPLLIISFDGFRDTYLQMNITPHIQRIFNCGTHSKYVIPAFPSKTFPNHYTLVTGLYPAWHGIVNNAFWDPTIPGEFVRPKKGPGWYLGEPIWKTVQKYHMKSAAYFWPGSEAQARPRLSFNWFLIESSDGLQSDEYKSMVKEFYKNQLPTYYTVYNSSVPYKPRADQVIEWLKLEDDKRPVVINLYFEEPDAGGHKGGPGSEEVRNGMVKVDSILNYLTTRLVEEGLFGCLNMILLSDHGMERINYNRTVLMNRYLPSDFKDNLYTGVVAQIAVVHNDTNVDALVEKMKCKNGTDFLVYKSSLIPSRFHYGGSVRTGQFLIQGRAKVFIMKDENELQYNIDWHGNHGFDNRLVSMRAIFAAIGPDVAEHTEIPEFENIELYNLFADLLGIEPAPNNGTRGRLYTVLKNKPSYVETSPDADHAKCVNHVQIINCSATCSDFSKMTSSCSYDTPTVQCDISNRGECILPFCDAVVHYNKIFKKVQMIETTISPEDWKVPSSDCVTIVANLTKTCPQAQDENYVSLFLYKEFYNTLDIARIPVSRGFKKGTWKYLLDKITHYVQFYGKMSLYAGAAYDSNGDSIRDSSQEIMNATAPTHIFVVLLHCPDNKEYDRHNCKNPYTLSFILPIIEEDFNCLRPDEYLFLNTARVRDIEILSGFQFFRNRLIWSPKEAIALRTEVPKELWQ